MKGSPLLEQRRWEANRGQSQITGAILEGVGVHRRRDTHWSGGPKLMRAKARQTDELCN